MPKKVAWQKTQPPGSGRRKIRASVAIQQQLWIGSNLVAGWSDEETDNPPYEDDRNFYKVEKWTRDATKVNSLLYAGNSLEKARGIFAKAIRRRPRITLTIRQRTRVLDQYPTGKALRGLTSIWVRSGASGSSTDQGGGKRRAVACPVSPVTFIPLSREPRAGPELSLVAPRTLARCHHGCRGSLPAHGSSSPHARRSIDEHVRHALTCRKAPAAAAPKGGSKRSHH